MKKIHFLILTLFSGSYAFAQTSSDSTVSQKDNLVVQSQTHHYSDTIPKSQGWVSDFEGIYTKPQLKTLDSLIATFVKKYGYEIAVITVDGSLTNDSSFDNYILNIANGWGIGKKGKDNGMVIGISSEFGRVKIVNGAGVSTKISDEVTKQIIENVFFAQFKDGKLYEGTRDGLLDIMSKLK